MKKYLIPALVACALIIIALVFWGSAVPSDSTSEMVSGVDPANTTYLIEGEEVLLVGGIAEVRAAPNSSSTVRTAIFEQPIVGDLNGDGNRDMALLLQRDMGGSGLFYYVVVALQNADTTAQGTNAIFVGDRIAPQSMEIKDGVVIFNYADRKPDEPMSTDPSVGVSLYARVQDGVLIQVEAPAQ